MSFPAYHLLRGLGWCFYINIFNLLTLPRKAFGLRSVKEGSEDQKNVGILMFLRLIRGRLLTLESEIWEMGTGVYERRDGLKCATLT